MKKLIALVMATLMIVGIVVLPAAAGFAGSEDITVTYDDATNTLSVLLSAKAFNDAYAAKTLTKDDLNDLLPSDMVEAYREDGIAGLLTTSWVKGIITRDQVFEIIPEALFADPDSLTVANIKANKSMLKGMIADFYAEILSVKVNGADILNDTADKIDLGKAEAAFLNALPANEKELASNPEVVLKAEFEYDSCGTTQFTVKVGFSGSEAEITTLKANLQSVASRLMYTINGTDVTVAAKIAKEQTEYVKKFLASSVSTEDKLAVLQAFNGTVEDLVNLIKNRSVDELQAIADKLDNENIDKVNTVIDNHQTRAESVYETLQKYFDKVFADKLTKSVADFYKGSGEFEYDKDISYTAEQLIDFVAKKVSAASQAADYVTGTLELGTTTNLLFEDLYRTTFHVGTESFTVYMPAGVDFADIMDILKTSSVASEQTIAAVAEWGKSTDGGNTFTAVATATTGADMDVYACATVKFTDNAGTKTIIVPVNYKIVAKDIPTAAEKAGFTAGDWYLKGDKTKAPLNYVVTGDVEFVVDYTANETTAEETTTAPNPPTGIEESSKANTGVIVTLSIVAVVASAGIAVCLKKKKEN